MDKEFITNENAMMREKFYTARPFPWRLLLQLHQMILQADGRRPMSPIWFPSTRW
jgi:hypothetical protein